AWYVAARPASPSPAPQAAPMTPLAALAPHLRRSIAAALRAPRVRGWAASAAVLALAGVLCFARLGERALWSMELRWAEIPREMALSGDPTRPTINGHLYYDKPLGSYWLVTAAAWLRGGLDETAARWPSAAAGFFG